MPQPEFKGLIRWLLGAGKPPPTETVANWARIGGAARRVGTLSRIMGERSRNRPWQQGLDEEKELGQMWDARREYLANAVKCRLKCVVRVRPSGAHGVMLEPSPSPRPSHTTASYKPYTQTTRVPPAHHADARAKICVRCEERIGPWVSVNGGPNLEFTTAVLGPASSQQAMLTSTSQGFRTVRMGYAYRPPAQRTYLRHKGN